MLDKKSLEWFKEQGKKGSEALIKKYGKNAMSELGRLGVKKRWAEHRKKKLSTGGAIA